MNIHETNGAAFEKEEIRRGVPLEYVSEKLVSFLYLAHGTQGLQDAIRDGLKAFLALHNMLGLFHNDLTRDVYKMNRKQFGQWLDRIHAEGSVE